MHEMLPLKRPVSAADRSLRACVTELVVHVPCGGVRGPIGRLYTRCGCPENLGSWQSCPCEDEPVRWAGVDVSREVDLCVLCARGTAGGVSRWASLACPSCLRVNDTAGRLLGQRPLPLYRHSIANGAAIRASAHGAEFARQHALLVDVTRSWRQLDDWFDEEVRRLAASQGWAGERQVLLRVWQERLPASTAASRDALRRLTGVDLDRHERGDRRGDPGA